ncbi:MAG: hypothetical protein IJ109_00990 [Firmicutes bacterium]|nr:hypothetical protein [Bacillota bacterium]
MTKPEQPFLNESDTLIRTPLDPATGQPSDTCRYALFPGMALAQSEPELVVLLYDSILHQYKDTAMFLYRGREGSDPLLNRKWSQRLLSRWRNLGKPTMIITTPEDMKFFRGILTEIPTVSLYDELLAHNISGGCSRELYRLAEPEQFGFEPAVRELAENMGAVLYDAGSQPEIDPEDAVKIPFLTSSIDVRNAMKKRGFEAVHILELIYGMGRSNQHLAHTHEGEHNHDAPPQVREAVMSSKERNAQEELFSADAAKRNLQDLRETLLAMFWNE